MTTNSNWLDNLTRIERSIDWVALIDKATATPPDPHELIYRFGQWSVAFEHAYGGPPLAPDFPDPMRAFFRRLSHPEMPRTFFEWADRFEERRGRRPRLKEIPPQYRNLLQQDPKRGGRPSFEAKRWRDAARAWTGAIYKKSYEIRRDGIRVFGKSGLSSNCFGYKRQDMLQESASRLAMEKLSTETGLSHSRLADLMGHRNKNA